MEKATSGGEWARMPTRAGERLEGFSRGYLYNLVGNGAVRSAAIHSPGCTKAGVRLIHRGDLLAFINRHVETRPPSAVED